MRRHLLTILCFIALALVILTSCGSDKEDPAASEEIPSLEECTFENSRVVINGAPDGYAGQRELEQAFDKDVFYYRDHVDSGGKYGYPILMRVESDGTVKAMCTLSGCRHDSPSCFAYDGSVGRYFTVGGQLYHLKTNDDIYSPESCLKIYRVTEDSRELIADINGSGDFYDSNENVITDGEWLYIMVRLDNGDKELKRVRLSDGTIETIAGFEQLSGGNESGRVIMYPSENGEETEISGYYGPIELQAVSDDGNYIIFTQKLETIRSVHNDLYVMKAFSRHDGSTSLIASGERISGNTGSLTGRLYFYDGSIYRLNRKDAAFEKRTLTDPSWRVLWDLSNEREKFESLQLKYFDSGKVIFKGWVFQPYISISTYICDTETGEVSVNNFKTRSTVLRNRRFPDFFAMSPDHVIIDVVNYENYTYDLAVMAKEDLYSENQQYRDIGFVSNFY